ncbi:MAG: TIGR02453 family protein, partial [Acidobacteriota bacterium]|nr:TIGR02453 family protein [Acidobacteriota bacterium]
MTAARHFTPATFAFMRELAANNNREWFNANKPRYEGVLRAVALEFIRDFEPQLWDISPYFCADDRKVGGSLFRIYRDVRFSKDKSPYKIYTGVQFRHAYGKDAHAPGFYL